MSIIDLNTADIFSAIGGGSPLSIIDSILHPSYSIRNHGASTTALSFSGMMSIQPSGGARIVTAPIENGKYQSINKVARPGRVVCDIVISGLTGLSGSVPNIFDLTLTSQSSTLSTIKEMIDSANLYDIDTPKDTYESYDLVDYTYTVNSKRGVSLLVVSLAFEEVRQQMEVSLSSTQSKNKLTNDEKQSGLTGVGGVTKQGSVNEAKIDGLKKSWSNLSNALSETATKVTDQISSGITSAAETVKGPLAETATAVTDKATDLVKSIKDAI
ncbi:phage baseplate protein [Lonsdalea quercina]|uniref:phage baseplate protein n=1 Tax=Lonsdalea quercina TaxID=71657 RepID=UPI003975FAB0